MKPYFAHPTACIDGEARFPDGIDPRIGAGTRIWHFCHVMDGARIGPNCSLGQNVFVAASVRMGEGCRIQNHVSLYDGVVLEDYVFCGPSMTFTNLSSPLPRAAIPRRDAYQPTVVRRFASIGAGAVIVCGHELGEACFVAAGSVVIRDVPAYALVAGNPARWKGWVCWCGNRLHLDGDEARCEAVLQLPGHPATVCGRRYRLEAPDRLVALEESP